VDANADLMGRRSWVGNVRKTERGLFDGRGSLEQHCAHEIILRGTFGSRIGENAVDRLFR
jgi:hypothetical protein